MDVSSGIKQGCTASTTLFKILTYIIIEKLEREGGYKDEFFKLSALFFADDGLLMSRTEEEMGRMIDILTELSHTTGLKINKSKSNILIFNNRTQVEEIKEIEVTHEMKYLGITVTNKRNCFRAQRGKFIQKARKLANLCYPIISQSCNKILIGKTFWKSIVLPSVLYGSSIFGYTKREINELQRIENSVYRVILGAPSYAQLPTLRGEIGSSTMENRIRENQLNYLKYVEENERNGLLRRIIEEKFKDKKDYWIQTTREFMKNIKLTYSELKEIGKQNLKKKVRECDKEYWKKEVAEKSSLKIYSKYKTEIKEEKFYDNRPSSEVLYRARTNNLKLNDRNRYTDGDTKCIMCNHILENLNHFLLWCTAYAEERKSIIQPGRLNTEVEENIIGELLFNEDCVEKTKIVLYDMWKKREQKRRNLETMN